jgi:hypothetical protein
MCASAGETRSNAWPAGTGSGERRHRPLRHAGHRVRGAHRTAREPHVEVIRGLKGANRERPRSRPRARPSCTSASLQTHAVAQLDSDAAWLRSVVVAGAWKDARLLQGRPERPRTLKEVFGPSSQAEMYLMRALEEFHHSANAPDLWAPVSGPLRDSLLESAQAVGTAKNRRLQFLRGTVLFVAIAIEAFANELLAELLEPRDLEAVDRLEVEAVDRLEVPDKLLIGTRFATGQSPLSRGAQPLQDVATLVEHARRCGQDDPPPPCAAGGARGPGRTQDRRRPSARPGRSALAVGSDAGGAGDTLGIACRC